MDPVRNPYAPGAGTPPPELAGRADLLAQGTTALQRVAQERPTQSLIMVGLRGVGKTVLLNRLNDQAENEGFRTY
jgi:Cdc6-like AAA superfamily ATPase